MNTGKPVTPDVNSLLYKTARKMVLEKKKRLKFKNRNCEGVLTTEWKSGSMGAISGMEFKAEMATTSGETTFTFLVRSVELEDLQWKSHGSIEEAEKFDAELTAAQIKKRGRLN